MSLLSIGDSTCLLKIMSFILNFWECLFTPALVSRVWCSVLILKVAVICLVPFFLIILPVALLVTATSS